jgi:hypothetical protein
MLSNEEIYILGGLRRRSMRVTDLSHWVGAASAGQLQCDSERMHAILEGLANGGYVRMRRLGARRDQVVSLTVDGRTALTGQIQQVLGSDPPLVEDH